MSDTCPPAPVKKGAWNRVKRNASQMAYPKEAKITFMDMLLPATQLQVHPETPSGTVTSQVDESQVDESQVDESQKESPVFDWNSICCGQPQSLPSPPIDTDVDVGAFDPMEVFNAVSNIGTELQSEVCYIRSRLKTIETMLSKLETIRVNSEVQWLNETARKTLHETSPLKKRKM